MIGYLSFIVLIPLAAVVWKSTGSGLEGFWNAVTSPAAVASLKLTLGASIVVALVNAAMGTLIAWVLVRDDFPGKGIVNSLIDLPFALPTIVAGLTLLALYGPRGPDRRQHRLHAHGGGRRAPLRHAALRRPLGAAGPARARHARWRRRPLRSGPAGSPSSAG